MTGSSATVERRRRRSRKQCRQEHRAEEFGEFFAEWFRDQLLIDAVAPVGARAASALGFFAAAQAGGARLFGLRPGSGSLVDGRGRWGRGRGGRGWGGRWRTGR